MQINHLKDKKVALKARQNVFYLKKLNMKCFKM